MGAVIEWETEEKRGREREREWVQRDAESGGRTIQRSRGREVKEARRGLRLSRGAEPELNRCRNPCAAPCWCSEREKIFGFPVCISPCERGRADGT